MLTGQNEATKTNPPRDVTGGGKWATVIGEEIVSFSSSSLNRRLPRLPEISLLTAMLEDAFDCSQGTHRGSAQEAHEWFASERRDWPFSFLNICDFLGFDAAALRERLGLHQLAAH